MTLRRIIRTLATVALFVAVAFMCGCKRDTTLRVLYWNFQNGMWADEPNNYDNFVAWVKSYDPDVCIWCEAQTIYKPMTNEPCKKEERYLTDNWGELAARYGHNYWAKGGHRDNYPQVITSTLPIQVVEEIVGEEPDSVVTHGAGHFVVEFNRKKLNIVTLHTWPQRHAFRCKDVAQSRAENGGDKYRRMEIEYICKHTIHKAKDADKELWLMAGDFNSRSRKDNHFYGYAADTSAFLTQDYVLEHTPYIDIIGERYKGEFHTTTAGKSRIDYIYCTPTLHDRIVDAYVVNDEYTQNPKRDQATGFHFPSDHLPILVDYDLK